MERNYFFVMSEILKNSVSNHSTIETKQIMFYPIAMFVNQKNASDLRYSMLFQNTITCFLTNNKRM
jgi:hypothetical protein